MLLSHGAEGVGNSWAAFIDDGLFLNFFTGWLLSLRGWISCVSVRESGHSWGDLSRSNAILFLRLCLVGTRSASCRITISLPRYLNRLSFLWWKLELFTHWLHCLLNGTFFWSLCISRILYNLWLHMRNLRPNNCLLPRYSFPNFSFIFVVALFSVGGRWSVNCSNLCCVNCGSIAAIFIVDKRSAQIGQFI